MPATQQPRAAAPAIINSLERRLNAATADAALWEATAIGYLQERDQALAELNTFKAAHQGPGCQAEAEPEADPVDHGPWPPDPDNPEA